MDPFERLGRDATFMMSKESAKTISQAARGLDIEQHQSERFISDGGIFGKCFKMGRIVAARSGSTLLLMHSDHQKKLRQMIESSAAFCAWHKFSAIQWNIRGHTKGAKTLVSLMVKGCIDVQSRAKVAKAIKALWFSSMMTVPESSPDYTIECEKAAQELVTEACKTWPAAATFLKKAKECCLALSETDAALELSSILKISHILSSEDYDALSLAENVRALTKKPDELKGNEDLWKRLAQFGDRLLLSMALRNRPSSLRGVDLDAEWVDEVKKRSDILPPHVPGWHMSNMCIEWQDYWWIEAQDATTLTMAGEIMSELSMALRYGPEFGSDKSWDIAIKRVIDEGLSLLLYWSAKAKNTKELASIRATASADEVHRVGFKTLDSNQGVLAEMCPGIGIGADKISMEKDHARMMHFLRSDARAVAISIDVESWSPSQDREMVRHFHKMLQEKLSDISTATWEQLWRNATSIVKRGHVIEESPFKNSTVQGFTVRSDTIMHFCLAKMAVMAMAKQKLTSQNCEILVWMDDVVCAVLALKKSRSAQELKNKICDFYRELGFSLDKIKSITGHYKFVYLNRFFVDGYEVLQTHKIAAKLATNVEGEFATDLDAVLDIASTSRSLVASGASACAATSFCLVAAYTVMFSRYRKVIDKPTDKWGCLMPLTWDLNGIQMPGMTHAMSIRVRDRQRLFVTKGGAKMKKLIRYLLQNPVDCAAPRQPAHTSCAL